MAAEAMQSAAAAMQGMAGTFAGIRPGMEPVAAGNPGFSRQLPYATELQQPPVQSSASAASRQQPATEHAFPAIPEMHGMVPETSMLASPFGAPQVLTRPRPSCYAHRRPWQGRGTAVGRRTLPPGGR